LNQNLIILAGLSHSGKDLLFNQFQKLGRSEPNLKINENLIYYDWLSALSKKKEGSYMEKLLPALSEKLLQKVNTLIYVHDISYQRLDDIETDFDTIYSNIHRVNKNFQVVLLVNRSHLIPNELERSKIQKNVEKHLQKLISQKILSYVVSLKGPDQQRMTNLIFTQIVNKSTDYRKNLRETILQQTDVIKEKDAKKIQSLLKTKMEECGFSGGYLVGRNRNIRIAVGKSEGWEAKVGPQIVRMLAQYDVFELGPKYEVDIIRIEDFVMFIKQVNEENTIIMIGRESVFKYDAETYPQIRQSCQEISEKLLEIIK
jgi:hypothetical protein